MAGFRVIGYSETANLLSAAIEVAEKEGFTVLAGYDPSDGELFDPQGLYRERIDEWFVPSGAAWITVVVLSPDGERGDVELLVRPGC